MSRGFSNLNFNRRKYANSNFYGNANCHDNHTNVILIQSESKCKEKQHSGTWINLGNDDGSWPILKVSNINVINDEICFIVDSGVSLHFIGDKVIWFIWWGKVSKCADNSRNAFEVVGCSVI